MEEQKGTEQTRGGLSKFSLAARDYTTLNSFTGKHVQSQYPFLAPKETFHKSKYDRYNASLQPTKGREIRETTKSWCI